MLNKKSASHVEIVMSFALFMLFVIFLLYQFNPAKQQNLGNFLLDILQDSIEEQASVVLFEVPFFINSSAVTADCFIVKNPFNAKYNITALSAAKNPLGCDASSADIKIKKSGSDKQYFLYYSPDEALTPPNSVSGCQNIGEPGGNYSFSAQRSYKLLSLNKLKELENNYNTDYNGLKEMLHFPSGKDFALEIKDLQGSSILKLERKKPAGIEIYARELPVELLNIDGTITKGIMNMQVW